MNQLNKAYRSNLALVTGGAKRVGRAMCLGLADMGFDIAVHYGSSKYEAESLAAEIEDLGRKASIFEADLAQAGSADLLYEQVATAMGQPAVLINNASVFKSESIGDYSEQTALVNWQLHVASPLSLIKKFAEGSSEALIVNMLDQRVLNPSPGFVSYNVSKAALTAATKSLAIELADKGIRVNGIAPGPVLPPPGTSGETFDDYCETMPLGRGSSPQEIIKVLRFLVDSQSVTGQIIASDGGQHLGYLSTAEALRNDTLKVNS